MLDFQNMPLHLNVNFLHTQYPVQPILSFAHKYLHPFAIWLIQSSHFQVLGDEEKRVRYDRGEDIEDMGMGMGGGGFNPFGGGGQQFTFHFEGGFPDGFHFWSDRKDCILWYVHREIELREK